MIVALTVLALLMLLGGLAAMVQGIPFIRLEVGWTMVIAGTVGASGGAVLLGIAAVIARLARIERALLTARPAAPLAGAPAFPDPGTAPVRPPRSEPVMPPIPTVTLPAQDARTSHDDALVAPERVAGPAPRSSEPTGLGNAAALAAGAAAVGFAAGELRLHRAEDADPVPPHEPQQAEHHQPDPTYAVPQEPAAAAPEPYSSEVHLPEPVVEAAPPPAEAERQDPEPHLPEPHLPARSEPEPVVEATPAEPAPAPEPVAEEPPRAEPVPEPPAPEEPAGKAVIGTYDAGDNTYTMYADGTIDAETPAGRFHFASIEELKAFRSAGGEGAARSA